MDMLKVKRPQNNPQKAATNNPQATSDNAEM